MKVIICGAGQVGFGIAERLAAEGNDVSLIDVNPALVERANDVLDVRATVGNGAHPDVLERAGAREADMLIAVTLADEVNMVACQVAHSLFAIPTKIARVRSQSYLAKEYAGLFSRDSMAIDFVISPEIEVGNMVLRRLRLPGAFETLSFADDRVLAVGINCGEDCPVVDTPIRQLSELFPDLPAVIVAIVRRGKLFLPHQNDQLEAGDDVYVVAPADQIARTLKIFGHEEQVARRVVIAGGGNIGLYVARALDNRDQAVRAKLIEANRARAIQIADELDRTVVLHGSALSEELLREAEVHQADTMVALTNDDQVNILASALAKHLGCRRTLCLINSPGYTSMVRSFGIDAQVNPRAITLSRILQFVRRGRIRSVHSIQDGAGELIEAEAIETAPIIGKPLKELAIAEGVRFGAIVRNGQVFAPKGTTELEPKDRAILFVRSDYVRQVEQLFRVSPEYF
ncbi:MAG: Trk system potassium transporter TrkA [Proteobacteria bacterium]|jgi:trk system potassium uptake protein TrkA|nr:MAG: Trk system potassium transporter TrkA [Pseudomonadota bacterium]